MSDNTSYGVYYNYAAASATYVTGSQRLWDEAIYSVCPAGWRLPTKSEQATIGSSSGRNTYVSTWLPVYAGGYGSGSLYNESSNGDWWSSTSYDSAGRYYMYYYSGKLYSGGNGSLRNGSSVRCILQQS